VNGLRHIIQKDIKTYYLTILLNISDINGRMINIIGKEWLMVPLLMGELKGLLNELTDEELEIIKGIALLEDRKCSDRSVSEET
jgi:hypothetical protein